MALHSTVREIIAASESLATELGVTFSSRTNRESGLLLSYNKRGSSAKRGFRLDLLFPLRGSQTPLKTSLHVYRYGKEIDSGIDIDPQRITDFSDVEYIIRRVAEERPQATRALPEIPSGAFTLSYEELSEALGAFNHDVEADLSGMTVSLYDNNGSGDKSVKLRFYEEPQKQTNNSVRLSLIGAELTTVGSGWTENSSTLPLTVVKSVYDLVNIVDTNLNPHSKKKRSTS